MKNPLGIEIDDDLLDEAIEIADQIEELVAGRHVSAVHYAIGLVLGSGEVRAKEPDLLSLMEIVMSVAQAHMQHLRAN